MQTNEIYGLALSSYPKLLFTGNPGALVSPAFAESFAKQLKNCRLVQLDSGIHYLQEDHPDVIGANIKEWLIEIAPLQRRENHNRQSAMIRYGEW